MDLIDRKYLLAYLAEIKPDEYVSAFGEAAVQVIGLIEEFVKEMPTIEPKVRHGRWNDKPDEYCEMNIIRHCSECEWSVFKGNPLYDFGHWNYCPNCGARMDGGDKDAAD